MAEVSVRRCPDYRADAVRHSVKKIFEDLDVLGCIIPEDCKKILLKVNLLTESAPEDGIVTHPALVEAVAQELRSTGAEIVIADSPSGRFTPERLERIYRKARLIEVAKKTGATLNYDTESVDVSFPEGRVLKQFRVLKAVQEADVLISLPKMKTHALTTFTGATKNLFGAIPGTTKVRYHAQFPSVLKFGDMLLDVFEFLSPSLAIMDGVVAMEGPGPSRGQLKKVGLIFGSTDCVALDAVACSLAGIPLKQVSTLVAARKRGLGETDPDRANVTGDGRDAATIDPFQLPTSSARARMSFPSWLDRWVTRFLTRPPHVIMPECRGCGICLENCPKDCVSITDGKAEIDEVRCQRCYCCQEVCPHGAIELV